MLTRRRLFSAVAALGAMLTFPFKARAAETPTESWTMPDLELPKKGHLVFIPIDPDQKDVPKYLAQFLSRFTKGKSLEEGCGCELVVRFHDDKGTNFGLKESHQNLMFRCLGKEERFETAFRLAVLNIESRVNALDTTAPSRFRAQVRSVSVYVKTQVLSPKWWYPYPDDVYQIFKLRKRA